MTQVPILEVRNLSKTFRTRGLWRPGREVRALQDVSFSVRPGEAFGVVGESGSGKSTLGRVILQLMAADTGEVHFKGAPIPKSGAGLLTVRRQMQAIFQDPYAALNPRMRVGTFIAEALRVHGIGDRAERVAGLLREVGLDPAVANRFPHEFSGGQRQRLCIARALALKPELIVADEPVTALDVSIQAQIVNLLQDMQDEHRLSYVFISHDLNLVQHFCQRAAVMQAGRVVEIGPVEALFEAPQHPYTRQLIASVPRLGLRRRTGAGATPSLPQPVGPEARLMPCGPDHFVLR